MSSESNFARVVGIDLTDSTTELESKYNGAELTVPAFNEAMREIALAQDPAGWCAKLRARFVFTLISEDKSESVLELRIDIDHRLSEGQTLMHRLSRIARFLETERGRRFTAQHSRPNTMSSKKGAEFYRGAARAALVGQESAPGKSHV